MSTTLQLNIYIYLCIYVFLTVVVTKFLKNFYNYFYCNIVDTQCYFNFWYTTH